MGFLNGRFLVTVNDSRTGTVIGVDMDDGDHNLAAALAALRLVVVGSFEAATAQVRLFAGMGREIISCMGDEAKTADVARSQFLVTRVLVEGGL